MTPGGPQHLPPPLGTDDAGCVFERFRQQPGEDERPTICFSLGDVSGRVDECGELVGGDCSRADRERADVDGATRLFSVLGITERAVGPHPQWPASKLDECADAGVSHGDAGRTPP